MTGISTHVPRAKYTILVVMVLLAGCTGALNDAEAPEPEGVDENSTENDPEGGNEESEDETDEDTSSVDLSLDDDYRKELEEHGLTDEEIDDLVTEVTDLVETQDEFDSEIESHLRWLDSVRASVSSIDSEFVADGSNYALKIHADLELKNANYEVFVDGNAIATINEDDVDNSQATVEAPFIMAPSEEETYEVEFRPLIESKHTEVYTEEVTVKGANGEITDVTLELIKQDFVTQYTSEEFTATVKNSGDVPLTVDGVVIWYDDEEKPLPMESQIVEPGETTVELPWIAVDPDVETITIELQSRGITVAETEIDLDR